MVCLHALAPECRALPWQSVLSAVSWWSLHPRHHCSCDSEAKAPNSAGPQVGLRIEYAVQNVTAAQAVVQTAAADPTTLAQADNIVKAVQSKLLINTLTGNLNVKGLAADPTIQASFVPLLEAASLASGPLWTAVNPPPAPVASVGLIPHPSVHANHAESPAPGCRPLTSFGPLCHHSLGSIQRLIAVIGTHSTC